MDDVHAPWGLPAIAGAVIFSVLCSAASADEKPHELYDIDTSVKAFCGEDCYFFNEGDPRIAPLLAREREILEQRALQSLAANPASVPEDFSATPVSQDDGGMESVGLDGTSTLVDVAYGPYNEFTDVFIASRRNGRSEIVWRLGGASPDALKRFPGIGDWSPCRASRDGCFSSMELVGMGVLPAHSDGSRLFYIGGTTRHEASCWMKNQFSIWKWEHGGATPLLLKEYPADCDFAAPAFDGKILRIVAKREFKSMGTYASGYGREMDWKIRVAGNRVADLGETPQVPEIDLIDSLLRRIDRKSGTEGLASPSVVALLRRNMLKPGAHGPTVDVGYDRYRLTQRGRDKALCLSLDVPFDGSEKPYLFTITHVGGKPFISRVEVNPEQSELCP